MKNDRVQQALQAGDAAAAALAVREGWSGVEQVEVLAADLANAYGDPAAFGYARLALLEAALAEAKPSLRVVRDGGGNRLGLAAPVQLGSLGPAVIYVRQPLLRLTSPLDQVSAPSAGFLGLRQEDSIWSPRATRAWPKVRRRWRDPWPARRCGWSRRCPTSKPARSASVRWPVPSSRCCWRSLPCCWWSAATGCRSRCRCRAAPQRPKPTMARP